MQVEFDHVVDIIRCGPGDDDVQFLRRDFRDRYFGCEHFRVFPPEDEDGLRTERDDR